MRVVFMGTPDFALATLKALLAAGHEIICVYSQPPRPAGRGMIAKASPVAEFALADGIEVRTPPSLRPVDEQVRFSALNSDAAVVVAYGLLLPKPLLDAPRLGCFNVHASLLPRWRGAAPIQRALMAGDEETGVTIMRMEEGLDTGPICNSASVAITPETTAGSLHDALAPLGSELMVRTLEREKIECMPQPSQGVTYARKIEKSETKIDFAKKASEVRNHIRGLSPSPGAWFEAQGARIRVLASEAVPLSGVAGTVLDDRLTVGCGEGAVRLLLLQREGKTPMDAASFLRGFSLSAGTRVS